jgi:hypothetical protein
MENRSFPTWIVLLQGVALGLLAYGASEWSIPRSVVDPGDHDLLLAQRLGLIYTPLVGLWLGWLQRSRGRAAAGCLAGFGIGLVYFLLCRRGNFLAIMVAFPCLLGACFAALAGSNQSAGLRGLAARVGKGFLAGWVLGAAYMFLLNMILDRFPPVLWGPGANYAQTMWKGGLPAMALASGLFFLLIRWSVGLSRMRTVWAVSIAGLLAGAIGWRLLSDPFLF